MAMSSSDDSSLSRTLDYVESTYRFEEVNGQMFVIGLYQFSEGKEELVFVESLPEVIETYGRFLRYLWRRCERCMSISFFLSSFLLFLCNFRQVFRVFLSCF